MKLRIACLAGSFAIALLVAGCGTPDGGGGLMGTGAGAGGGDDLSISVGGSEDGAVTDGSVVDEGAGDRAGVGADSLPTDALNADGGCHVDGDCRAGGACCGGTCVEASTDRLNCGKCGKVCGDNANASGVCVAGGCANHCDPGFGDCNGSLTDGCEAALDGDPKHCGSCATACDFANASGTCATGACVLGACGTGFADCDHDGTNGCEVTLAVDVASCGACGHRCTAQNASPACTAGACGIGSCATGFADCDAEPMTGCEVATDSDPANCGACANACVFAHAVAACVGGACRIGACDAGRADCNGVSGDGCESDLDDPGSCGACAHVCAVTHATAGCAMGACTVAACDANFADCDMRADNGCETAIDSDPTNCGGCGVLCTPPHSAAACIAQVCTITQCLTGYADCNGLADDGCEVDLSSDTGHCGACGTACAAAHATSACSAGSCVVATCDAGYGDCDHDVTNGCEVTTDSDLANCGGCGSACSPAHATAACTFGKCLIASCDAGYADCDALRATGCEADLKTDPAHCGACTTPCTIENGVAGCAAGACTVASCSTGFGDCDAMPGDGCEANFATDRSNCLQCARVGGAEMLCDGVDDNCDGTVDEGCPIAIDLDTTHPFTGALHGGNGSSSWSWPTSVANPLVGITGTSGCYVLQLSLDGGVLTLGTDTTTTPYTYSVTVPAGAMSGSYGGTTGTAFSGPCPTGAVVTGVYGGASSDLDRLGVYCGTPTITGSAPKGYSVTTVDAGAVGPFGGTSAGLCNGGTAFDEKCPSGSAVGLVSGRTGTNPALVTDVAAIQITCFPLALVVH